MGRVRVARHHTGHQAACAAGSAAYESEGTKPNPNPNAATWLAQLDEVRVFVSVATLAEIRHGIERMAVGQRRQESILAPAAFGGFDEVKLVCRWIYLEGEVCAGLLRRQGIGAGDDQQGTPLTHRCEVQGVDRVTGFVPLAGRAAEIPQRQVDPNCSRSAAQKAS
jgi:hypothetical protein